MYTIIDYYCVFAFDCVAHVCGFALFLFTVYMIIIVVCSLLFVLIVMPLWFVVGYNRNFSDCAQSPFKWNYIICFDRLHLTDSSFLFIGHSIIHFPLAIRTAKPLSRSTPNLTHTIMFIMGPTANRIRSRTEAIRRAISSVVHPSGETGMPPWPVNIQSIITRKSSYR